MSTTSDYKFNNLSRIGDDSCAMSQRNVQNVEAGSYMLQNYFSSDCTMRNGIDLALSQPNINFKGAHQVGVGGCNVDDNSALLIDKIWDKPKCRISLYQRPFATVPFLGRGACHPELESQLQHGDRQSNKKSLLQTTEQSHIPYSATPLIPSLAQTITNPVHHVESVAMDGWVRGGIPSRELAKNNETINH
jgi:hypothetical protein